MKIVLGNMEACVWAGLAMLACLFPAFVGISCSLQSLVTVDIFSHIERSFFMTVPFIMDIFYGSWKCATTKSENFFSRASILCNSLVLFVLVSTSQKLKSPEAIIIVVHIQLMITCLSILNYLSEFKGSHWSMKGNRIIVSVLIVLIGMSNEVFFSNKFNTFPLGICTSFACLIGVIMFCYRILRWHSSLKLPENKLAAHDIFHMRALIFSISCLLIGLGSIHIIGFIFTLQWEICISIIYLNTIINIVILTTRAQVSRLEVNSLQATLEAKKAYARTQAHEIRTPMNTLKVGLDLLQKRITELQDTVAIELLEDTEQACMIALNLVNDSLTFDRIEEGRLFVDHTPLSLWTIIHDAIRPFHIQAKHANIQLQIHDKDILEINSYLINGDRTKLGQVVRNLISNAIKFTPKRGIITVRVEVVKKAVKRSSFVSCIRGGKSSVTVENLWFRLIVTDTGAGISQENQKRLFREIIQFNPGKLQKGGGTGLGLWITRGIVELHKGNIMVVSEGEGHGSSFIVELPVYRQDKPWSNRSSSTNSSDADGILDGVKPNVTLSNSQYRVAAIRVLSRDSSISSIGIPTFETHNYEGNFSPCIQQPSHISIGSITSNSNNNHFDSPSSCIKKQSLSIGSAITRMESYPPPHYDNNNSYNSSNNSSSHGHSNYNHQYNNENKNESKKFLRVLVVDDALLNRKMVCRLLKTMCEYVVQAEDGIQAIKSYMEHENRSKSLDIIFMDYEMPRMNGPNAAREIRAMGYKGKIIGLTGNSCSEDIDNFIMNGADAVLIKPVDTNAIESILSEFYSMG